MLHADIRRQTATAAARSIAAAAKTSAAGSLNGLLSATGLPWRRCLPDTVRPFIDGSFASSTTHHLPKTF